MRTTVFRISCSKSNYNSFYEPLGMRNQIETQNERSQGKYFSKIPCIICLEGGGDLRTIAFITICSKSNSIMFYRSLEMRNQVETQKERSQGGSFSKILSIICQEGGLRKIGFIIIYKL